MHHAEKPFHCPPGWRYDGIKLGEGSYGEVFLVERPCIDPETKEQQGTEQVAIKRIVDYANQLPTHPGDPQSFLKRISREVCSLRHFTEQGCPGVVEVKDVYLSPDGLDLHMVMTYYNTSLLHLFQKPELGKLKDHLDEHHIRWMMCQVLCGVYEMHQAGVMHRDLGLGNLLLNKDGFECVIADLGLSRVQVDAEAEISLNVVSLNYRSPELLLGCKGYTNALDVWSCGVVLAQLMTKSQFLSVPYKLNPDARRQLWTIMDTFAGFPTVEDVKTFREDHKAALVTLRDLEGHRSRAVRIEHIEEELKRFAVPPPAVQGTAGRMDVCRYSGLPLHGIGLYVIDARTNEAVPLLGSCITAWANQEGGAISAGLPEIGNGVCLNSQQPLTDPAEVIVLTPNPTSDVRCGILKSQVNTWRQEALARDVATMRKHTPRALAEPKHLPTVLMDFVATTRQGCMSQKAAEVIGKMLVFDPSKRATVREILEMDWWQEDEECVNKIQDCFSQVAVPCPDHIESMDVVGMTEYVRSVCTIQPFPEGVAPADADAVADAQPQSQMRQELPNPRNSDKDWITEEDAYFNSRLAELSPVCVADKAAAIQNAQAGGQGQVPLDREEELRRGAQYQLSKQP